MPLGKVTGPSIGKDQSPRAARSSHVMGWLGSIVLVFGLMRVKTSVSYSYWDREHARLLLLSGSSMLL